MIILGMILLIVGFSAKMPILWSIGIILSMIVGRDSTRQINVDPWKRIGSERSPWSSGRWRAC
jgi:hypothetical protein